MVLLWILSVVAGSRKSKMAASKPDILISQLLDKIETKFQRLTLHFRDPATQWGWLKYCATKPEVKNPIWRPPNRIYIYLRIFNYLFRFVGRHLGFSNSGLVVQNSH